MFTRGGGTMDKKRTAASEIFKQKLAGKILKEKTFKQRVDEVVEKYLADYNKSGKYRSAMVGGKQDDKPKEPSKNVKEMMIILANRQIKKEVKQKKKEELELERLKKKKMQEENRIKTEYQRQQDIKAREATEAASAKSYFFGYTDDQT
jgi:hypothetical protein